MRSWTWMWAIAGLAACKAEPEPEKPAGGDTAGETDDTGEPDVADPCADLGLTSRPWVEGGTGADMGEIAADLTIETTTGDIVLSEAWTGCDIWMLINVDAEDEQPLDFFDERGLEDMLLLSPPNVHWVFLFSESSGDDRDEYIEELDDAVSGAISRLDDEDLEAWWMERVHIGTDRSYETGWFGDVISMYGGFSNPHPAGAAIDRFQTIREYGYWCDPTTGWEDCDAFFAAYEAIYFNFESDRQDRLDAIDATVVDLLVDTSVSDPGWAGNRARVDVEIPDLTGFDTLEIELELECLDRPERTSCPPWDYLVNLAICDEDDPATTDVDESETCNTEFGRWVTTYWRPGKWVHDVSPYMALLGDGGNTRGFTFYTQQEYITTIRFRFSNEGKGVRAVGAEKLFTGGRFNWRYNWGRTVDIDSASITMSVMEGHAETFAAVSRDDEARFLVAQNGSDNSWDRNDYSRFDWTWDESGGLWICHAIGDASDAATAAAVDFSCLEDDPETADVDESTQCTGANPEDLETGCNSGAWTSLGVADDRDPAGQLDGAWQEVWNESKLPKTFTPPAGTQKVELVSTISGHGFGDTNANCAEFCDHQHSFSFNGAGAHTFTNPWIGSTFGCAEQVADGVVPNQSGTWVYGRGGWCPGQEVPQWVVDVTGDVTVGAENTVSYVATHGGDYWAARSTGARVDMHTWVVYYE